MISPEQKEIHELAIFIHETYEDAARLHGVYPPEAKRIPFSKLGPEYAKAMLATASALRDRMLTQSNLPV